MSTHSLYILTIDRFHLSCLEDHVEVKVVKEIRYRPIGIIHSPFKDINGTPIQSIGARGVKGFIEIAPEYSKGLEGIEGFSYIILLYHFHLSKGFSLKVQPFLSEGKYGVFATRAPKRPNPIGLSIVKLIKVRGTTVYVEDVDIVDTTPLLDLKPYVPQFDARDTNMIGWLTEYVADAKQKKADNRFR